MAIEIYTDGASTQINKATYIAENEDPRFVAGWALCFQVSGKTFVRYGYLPPPSSNNRGELIGVIEAMKIAQSSKQDFIIYSDSQYCTKGVLEYMENWNRKGWQGIKNPDLWKSLYPIWQEIKHRTKIQWVRGHNGNYGNEMADKYAVHGKLHEDLAKSDDKQAIVFLTGNRPYEIIT